MTKCCMNKLNINKPSMNTQNLLNFKGAMLCVSIVLYMFVGRPAHAQSSDIQNTSQQPESQQSAATDEVLRLEQTIRANKEQPQVLTIVPWQLPKHQRLNEAQTWQPVVETLPLIERGQFLRDLSVVNDVMAQSAAEAENKP